MLIDQQDPLDGLWIDQRAQLLYIGNLYNAKFLVFSLPDHGFLGVYDGIHDLGCAEVLCIMDDFTLDGTGPTARIVATVWTNGSIVTMPVMSNVTGQEEHTLVTGLFHPTSARWGSGLGGFSNTSLFISEGGGFSANDTQSKLLEVRNVRSL